MKNRKVDIGLVVVVKFSLFLMMGGVTIVPTVFMDVAGDILKKDYEEINTWQHFMAFEKYQRN